MYIVSTCIRPHVLSVLDTNSPLEFLALGAIHTRSPALHLKLRITSHWHSVISLKHTSFSHNSYLSIAWVCESSVYNIHPPYYIILREWVVRDLLLALRLSCSLLTCLLPIAITLRVRAYNQLCAIYITTHKSNSLRKGLPILIPSIAGHPRYPYN